MSNLPTTYIKHKCIPYSKCLNTIIRIFLWVFLKSISVCKVRLTLKFNIIALHYNKNVFIYCVLLYGIILWLILYTGDSNFSKLKENDNKMLRIFFFVTIFAEFLKKICSRVMKDFESIGSTTSVEFGSE